MTTEQFHWTSPGGVKITLPRLGKIKSSILRKNRTKDPDDYMFSILEEVADPEMLAKVDDLDAEDFGAMTDKWSETMSAGESSGSST